MVMLIPFPEEWWEGGHDLCPSLLGKCKSVVLIIPIPLPEGSWEAMVGGEGQRSWPPHSLESKAMTRVFFAHPLIGMGGV